MAVDLKTGWKTSEFWLSLAAIIFGAVAASGVLPSGHWSVQVIGIVTTILGALGYTYSRTVAKRNGNGDTVIKLVPFILITSLFASGCSWERAVKTTLSGAYDVAKLTETTAIPLLHQKAMTERDKCAAAQATTCPEKDKWQTIRHQVEKAVAAVYQAVGAGEIARLLGKEIEAKTWVSKLGLLLSSLAQLTLQTGASQ